MHEYVCELKDGLISIDYRGFIVQVAKMIVEQTQNVIEFSCRSPGMKVKFAIDDGLHASRV
jgi:hypothetical protein